jgi:alkylresorcinol/alkylpyrone synthase
VVKLFIDAATKALTWRDGAADVDTVVIDPSTGARQALARSRGKWARSDYASVPVLVWLRRRRYRPGHRVATCAITVRQRGAGGRRVELCTLSLQDELTKANIVATFCLAMALQLVYPHGRDCYCRAGIERTTPVAQHAGHHGWSVDPQGSALFDRAIPPFAEAHMAPAGAACSARGGLMLKTSTGWLFIRAARKW